MKHWAIIPVKDLSSAKSRLAPAMSLNRRRALILALLERTLDALRAQKDVEGVLVVGKDQTVATLARKYGAEFVREPANGGLNCALSRATLETRRRKAEAVMVLPADLPLLRSKDLTWILRIAHRPPFVVIVPDHTGSGTNCLVMAPPGLIPWSFGRRSFERHRNAARRRGVEPFVCLVPALAEDIDRPEDLLRVLGRGWEPKITGRKVRAGRKSVKRRVRPTTGRQRSNRR